MKYDAFISYRHLPNDKAVAMQLQKLLEGYKPPKGGTYTNTDKITRIFRDESELPTSNDLGSDIRDALEQSGYLIVICSPDLKESKWCLQEIDYFKELHGGRTNHILPVLIGGNPGEVFPDALRHDMQIITLENGSQQTVSVEVEPLASNIVAKSFDESLKKLKVEFLRIAAPLLGCAFDDLFGRQHRRARQRVIVAAAAVLAVAGIFTGSVLYQNAMIQEQRNIAVFNAELAQANEARAVANEAEALAQKAEAERQSGIARNNEIIALENEAEAERQSGIARENEIMAKQERDKALASQSLFLAPLSKERTAAGDTNTAIMLALEALPKDLDAPDRPYVFEAESALRQAMQPVAGDGFVPVLGSSGGGGKFDNLQGMRNPNFSTLSSKGNVFLSNLIALECREYNIYTGEMFYSGNMSSYSSESFTYSPDGDYIVCLDKITDENDEMSDIVRLTGPGGKEWVYFLQTEFSFSSVYRTNMYFAPNIKDGVRIAMNFPLKLEVLRLDETSDTLVKEFENTEIRSGTINRKDVDLRLSNIAWSPDGARLLAQYSYNSGDANNSSVNMDYILDGYTGKTVAHFSSNSGSNISRGGWSADGQRIFTSNGYETTMLWDANTYTMLASKNPEAGESNLRDEKLPIYVKTPIIFSPDGKLISVLNSDGYIHIYSASDGVLLSSIFAKRHSDVQRYSWSADSSMLLFNEHRTTIFAWDAQTGERINIPDIGDNPASDAAFIPGTNDIAVLQYNRSTNEPEFRVWRLAENNITFDYYDGDTLITPQSRTIIGFRWTSGGHLCIRDEIKYRTAGGVVETAGWCELRDPVTLERVNVPSGNLWALDYSGSGRYVLASGYSDTNAKTYGICDTRSDTTVYLQIPGHWDLTYRNRSWELFSPDERKVQFGAGIFDASTGKLLYEFAEWLEDPDYEYPYFKWSPDGKRFAYIGAGYDISISLDHPYYVNSGIYNAETFEKIFGLNDIGGLTSIEAVKGHVYNVDFSPDMTKVVINSGKYVYAVDMNGELLVRLRNHDSSAWTYRETHFSPDGELLFVYSLTNELMFYSTSSWEALYTVQWKQGITAVPPRFSYDGSMFVSPDGTVYRASDGKELVAGRNLSLLYGINENYAAAFSSTDYRYAVWHGNSIDVYEIKPLEELIADAYASLNGRVFTQAEREKYLLE